MTTCPRACVETPDPARTVLGVLTGLIYVAIAVAWLAYLVPLFLRRHADNADGIDPRAQLRGVRIIRDTDDEDDDIRAEVSTPLTRRAKMAELRRIDRQRAARRRRVLVALMVLQTAAAVVAVGGWAPRWVILIPMPLLVGFFALARVSVTRMHAQLQADLQAVRDDGDEECTVLLGTEASVATDLETTAEVARSSQVAGSLWEPLPVTTPTYVSRPLAPRTVRTIDLSSPELTAQLQRSQADKPVTAEPHPAPQVMADPVVADEGPEDDEGLPRAVGE